MYDVGIICAMSLEAEKLKNNLCNPVTIDILGIKYYTGLLYNKKVVICISGIGKVAAAICAQTMIIKFEPELIINTGVAGSLSSDIKIGDIVISESFVLHDMDTSALGDPKGFLSGINVVYLPASKEIVDTIKIVSKNNNYRFFIGIIATGDQFINGVENKQRLHDEFGAIACDMEGGAIAQVCYTAGIKICAIRSMSDELNGNSHIDFSVFSQQASDISARITGELIKLL